MKVVFLDRDGVLLDHGGSIFPGTRAALLRLKAEGYLLPVVTNQPDIAAGLMDLHVADRVNSGLSRALPLDGIYMCHHIDGDNCKCRKPKPGLLLTAAQLGIDLPLSFMVGDRWRDISAGNAAGCQTILIGTGYGEPFPIKPDHRAADLSHAVDIILGAP